LNNLSKVIGGGDDLPTGTGDPKEKMICVNKSQRWVIVVVLDPTTREGGV
jgi:hypothetical protein